MREDLCCPECGGLWTEQVTCETFFHQMGFWELDFKLWDVHHLMVLCYHLQHPSLYSSEGLKDAVRLLVEFVEVGLSPQQIRQRDSNKLDSGRRGFKVSGTSKIHGSYAYPVRWTMTAVHVVAAGRDHYYASVRQWALSVLGDLRASGNLQADLGQ
ncbi:MAG: DUF5946 family protein [Anaerolineae bacterium]